MPRKESMAVLEGNGPIPQDTYVMAHRIILEDFRRITSEAMDKTLDKHFGQKPENPDELRKTNQRVASLEKDARQPRLARQTGQQTPRTASTRRALLKQYKRCMGYSCSAKRIQDGAKSSTTFEEKVEPPALPCRDNVVVENGAAARKLCLSHMEMRTPTVAGGLPPPARPLQRQGPRSTSHLSGSTRPRRRIL